MKFHREKARLAAPQIPRPTKLDLHRHRQELPGVGDEAPRRVPVRQLPQRHSGSATGSSPGCFARDVEVRCLSPLTASISARQREHPARQATLVHHLIQRRRLRLERSSVAGFYSLSGICFL